MRGFRIAIAAGVTALAVYLLTITLPLFSAPSTGAVIAGVMFVLTLFGACWFILPWIWRKAVEAPKAALAIMMLLAAASGCTRIDAGHVGVKINLSGTYRGASDVPVTTGWVFYNPAATQVFEYPTFVQTANWSAAADDDGYAEEVVFQDRDGVPINADISLSYQLAAEKVPAFYVKFRSDDLAAFTHGFLRNTARDAFNEVASSHRREVTTASGDTETKRTVQGYTVEELLGPDKEVFFTAVRGRINNELHDLGVQIQQFGVLGTLKPPKQIADAINRKIQAIQEAITTENQLREREAAARKVVADATGAANSAIEAARGAAEARIKVAEAEASANRMLAASLSPQVIRWRELSIQQDQVTKWNGALPQVAAGGQGTGFLLQLPSAR